MAVDHQGKAATADARLNPQLVGEIGQAVPVEPPRGGYLRPPDRRAPPWSTATRRAAWAQNGMNSRSKARSTNQAAAMAAIASDPPHSTTRR